MSSKRVLIPVADGSEDIETVTLIDVLRRADAEVCVASVAEQGRLQITAARGTRITADCHIETCADDDWDLIAVPGGMPGAERLRDCPTLTQLLQRQAAAERAFAAICAAPQVVLAHHGLLEGYSATGHPAFREQLPHPSDEAVVVDRHCYTSQAPGTALAFALRLVEALFGRDQRDRVAAPMVVNL